MNRPADRVVPTLTEVLDEQYWQPVEMAAASEVQVRLAPELPELLEPIIDLSDQAVVERAPANVGEHELLLDADEAFGPDDPPVADAPVADALSALPESASDQALREALSVALVEAIPAIVDMLVPVLRERLGAGVECAAMPKGDLSVTHT